MPNRPSRDAGSRIPPRLQPDESAAPPLAAGDGAPSAPETAAPDPATPEPPTSEPAAAAPTQPGYRSLRVWQKALELAGGVFALTADFPKSASDSLGVPLRRASAAVPAAIAEGNVRYTPREYAHYLSQALGTVAEVETLLFLAVRLGLATEARIAPLLAHCVEIGRMLRGLNRSVQLPAAPITDRPARRRSAVREPSSPR